ncbi:ferredoxin-NADP reductase [candidate division WOR-1 bacterium RIFOXYD2_FULL_36_8]|uniref:Ferredoxin-NADP reductase n=1 Tax=candidate division WOR-1 bacterium RIFOXYB2_FULL_36_35 TaxID=1802578 RepID=A0A1F4RX66_UNCSA|nr:MAG: ferredoxin-NADP reductase [candidate division WOR-1 bacterium RIFOXYA2_FULL_36_21]OGC12760.1 MAG: ferredoxin-NADP reductase [candidate division WOR-1 bacterium RIFOXYB2_FULL_36_35]OGC19795.1 MAG: ferredoxin-NADP reductase [candidate division WOR-1 bacterium RIFOXYA12_FULL_36_13]OGC38733.1 MAG: ferredoxin-NADP reductase [candidate division WOR-1 bacterium RIFOXYD2_FULL_36_8]
MVKILKKKKLSNNISQITVEAPYIAEAAKPGQFVIVVPTETSERIPLTIADFDTKQGTVTIIFQVIGATTTILDFKKEGEEIAHILGPLGVPSHIEMFGTVVVIGGGVGIAEIYPVVKALREKGNEVITIIGARCEELLVYKKELSEVSSTLLSTTDDGSFGRKGFVSDELRNLIASGKKLDRVISVGPVPMMKVCCDVTKPHGIKTMVSLNTLMLDATGMCGVCRVTVGGEVKFACVEGPEFDGHQVDFNELSSRLNAYKDKEKEANDHVCRLLKNG